MIIPYNVEAIREDFPILTKPINNNQLVYLDNGASAQKPKEVIETVSHFYRDEYANVHRGLYSLSNQATEKYESVREIIREFINANSTKEIVYTTGSTEGINMVAYGWAEPRLKEGDEVILTLLEHHSNIVPWNILRDKIGIKLKWVLPDEDGNIFPEDFVPLISPRTRLIAVTHTSNVMGTILDIKDICGIAHKNGIPVLADASQSAVHMPIDVQELGVDFLVITGHKLYGPTASGALYIHAKHHNDFVPFKGGGNMIKEVKQDYVTYNTIPHMLEAGTTAIAQMIGLGTALNYITKIGIERIHTHEKKLLDYTKLRLLDLKFVRVHGDPLQKCAIFSFTLKDGGHPHDLSTILDQKGIAVRAGHHCAQPLMDHLQVSATCRVSFGLYNTIEEVDQLVDGLHLCHRLLN